MSTINERLLHMKPLTRKFYLDPHYAQEHHQYDLIEVQLNWDHLTLRLAGFNNSTIFEDDFDTLAQMNTAAFELWKHRKEQH